MLNINVTDDYKLVSDGTQIIVQRKHIIDPSLSPNFDASKHSSEKREEWKTFKYAGKVSQAIDLILKQRIFESEANDLKELRNEITSFREYISEILND